MTIPLVRPVKSTRKPKGEGHFRRGEILAAAEKIFVECGYEGATIRKIADEVGVSSTALYMHFKDKSEILLEICQGSFRELIEKSRDMAAAPGDPAEKVRFMLRAYAEFGLQHPNAYSLVMCQRPISANPDGVDLTQAMGRQVFEVFLSVVNEVSTTGRLKHPPVVAAQTLWAGIHGVIALVITKPYFAWTEPLDLAQAMLDSLYDGMFHPA